MSIVNSAENVFKKVPRKVWIISVIIGGVIGAVILWRGRNKDGSTTLQGSGTDNLTSDTGTTDYTTGAIPAGDSGGGAYGAYDPGTGQVSWPDQVGATTDLLDTILPYITGQNSSTTGTSGGGTSPTASADDHTADDTAHSPTTGNHTALANSVHAAHNVGAAVGAAAIPLLHSSDPHSTVQIAAAKNVGSSVGAKLPSEQPKHKPAAKPVPWHQPKKKGKKK